MTPRKPEIGLETIAKWRDLVEIIARLANAPSSLIMKTEAPMHSVLVCNQDGDSPYRPGQTFRLSERLYCQAVLSREEEVLVEDAPLEPRWRNNDDLEFGMTFYLGLPLKWPDGELFGTICILDRRRNEQALLFREGLRAFSGIIETDLALLAEVRRREETEAALQRTLAGLEQEVAARTDKLRRTNAALQVLVDTLQTARDDYEAEVRGRIRRLVQPGIARLRQGIGASEPHRTQIDLIEASLSGLLDRRAGGLSAVFEQLTPAEVQVTQLILHGYSTKAIARRMGRGASTVDFHRHNIRRKLALGRSANLRSFLLSLQ